MKHVVSFSGGRTSAYLVYLMEQKRKNEGWDVEYVFMDTGAEHPKTYEFVRNVVKYWGINLRCIRAVINPELGKGVSYQLLETSDLGWDLSNFTAISIKHGTPCFKAPDCTKLLKTRTYDKYCKDVFKSTPITTWLGIRVDESRRLKPRDGVKYLAQIDWKTKPEIVAWWERQSFDLNLPEWLGNCVFCIKKDVKKLALAAKQEPELAKQWQAAFPSEKVRRMGGVDPQKMYRMKMSLGEIIHMFDDHNESDLEFLILNKRSCGNPCGDSCELDFGDCE